MYFRHKEKLERIFRPYCSSNLFLGSIPVGAYACTARMKPSNLQ